MSIKCENCKSNSLRIISTSKQKYLVFICDCCGIKIKTKIEQKKDDENLRKKNVSELQ